MKHYGYIYKTTNLINNKIYIGKRVKSKFDIYYKGSGKILKLAFKKYGLENFICEVLEWCDSSETLNKQEQHWIKILDARNPSVGYNIAKGGNGGDIYHSLPIDQQAEIALKLSKRVSPNKGRYKVYHPVTRQIKAIKPEELNNFLQEGWLRGLPPELLKQQGNTRRGKLHSDEWINNFKETIKNKTAEQKAEHYKKLSEATKRQMASYSAEEKRTFAMAGVKARLEKRGNKKVIWVNKEQGKIKKIIFEDELEAYLLDGFKKGMK